MKVGCLKLLKISINFNIHENSYIFWLNICQSVVVVNEGKNFSNWNYAGVSYSWI